VGVRRTRGGLRMCRAAGPGSRVALVAPASPFDPSELDRGVAELRRLGFEPEYDPRVFERLPMVAGPADVRAAVLRQAWSREDIDAIVGIRGGYGSVETLPLLRASDVPEHPALLVGYSDLTTLHTWLNLHVGVTSVHGAMVERRLARGAEGHDEASFVASLASRPLGEVTPEGVEVLREGEARGMLCGGTITQLAASLGTPWPFAPPAGAVILLEDVGERPYRLRRLLTQLRLARVFDRAAAIVVGALDGCDEPGGSVTARGTIAEFFEAFPGPILLDFPTGHTARPFVSLPFGVDVRVVAHGRGRLVFEEAAAA
jgi:muramoyltetrapeptide carboxypeptidase